MNSMDDPTAPSWLNEDLIQKALCKKENKNSKVEKLSIRRAAGFGDNYASVLRKVTATLSDGSQHDLLVKTIPDGAHIGQGVLDSGMFQRETAMLSKIVPQMQALLETAAPGRWSPLVAHCPLDGLTPTPFIILEDLSSQGFRMTDKQQGLGLRHTLLAMRALARFHAASHLLLTKNPAIAEDIDNPWERNLDGSLKPFTESCLQNAANACRTWKGFEKYADVLEKFRVVAVNTIRDLNNPKPGRFNVINHGDFWLNNLLFSYEEGKPKDVRMVDFQLSHVASPAMDLLYFLTSSVSEDVSKNFLDLVTREYYVELRDTLSLLGIKAPSLEVLLADMDGHGRLAVFGAACILPLLKAPRALDLNATVSGDVAAGAFMYKHPPVTRWIQRVLPEYERNGWLPT